MATIQELTTKLNQALKLKAQIEALEEKFDAILGGAAPEVKIKRKMGRPNGKRTMSPEGRAAIAAAQKARWAKVHGKTSSKKATPATTVVKAAPKKKVMSPEAKAKIAAAMKARWAAKKQDDAAFHVAKS